MSESNALAIFGQTMSHAASKYAPDPNHREWVISAAQRLEDGLRAIWGEPVREDALGPDDWPSVSLGYGGTHLEVRHYLSGDRSVGIDNGKISFDVPCPEIALATIRAWIAAGLFEGPQ